MSALKTRSLEEIEEKMANIDEDSIRYSVLKGARNFKTSWVELGQALYAVWKDRLYKDWGYLKFDAYTSKEIGIRKETALKLLKSYYFLEQEEPRYLKKDQEDAGGVAAVPTYEAVNVLRLAKNKKVLDPVDYSRLKKEVLDMGKDAREVKRDLVSLIREREELEPEEARRRKRVATLRRLVGVLKTIQREVELAKLLPSPIIKETYGLIRKIEAEIN